MTTFLRTTWFGAFAVDGAQVVRREAAPVEPGDLAERIRLRRAGRLTPEEESILRERGPAPWSTNDRRLEAAGVAFDAGSHDPDIPEARSTDTTALRTALLLAGEQALAEAWDPSVHVQEAVRAAADLDRVRNLIGERLGAWVARDRPEVDPGDHDRAVREALATNPTGPLAPQDPGLERARRQLAELYRAVESARATLTAAVESTSPAQAPNLARLLGPELSARLIAQAGGLERLARLPASTVQVLGAERAFFEHLRGRAPPPRHGLLFVHPAIQSAPRRERGRLARSLAGKASIAARLDAAGAAVDLRQLDAFERRRADLKARRVPGGRRSRKPLDGAARDG